MTVWARLYDRLDDGLNPILVKELRQAVKSRIVIGILFLFLVMQFMIVTIGITNSSDLSQWTGGRRVFLSQQIVLYFTILTALPAYCGARMLGERTDPGGDLMFLNSLNPATIVIGKLLASLAIGLLVFSVCAPFMTLAYLLRGIDLVMVFSILGLDLALMILAMQFALFTAALPGGLAIKRLACAAGFVGLLFFGYTTNRGLWFSIESGLDYWFWIVPALIPLVIFFGYFFAYSIVLVGAPASNGMMLVRLYLLATIILTWSILALVVWFWPTGPGIARGFPPSENLPLPFAFLFGFLLCLQLLVSTCERDHFGARIARTIPKWRILRPIAFLFYSGSAGGILYTVLCIALTLGLARLLGALNRSGRPFIPSQLNPLIVLTLYTYCFAMIGYLIQTRLFSRYIKAEQTWIVSAVVLGVLSTMPNIIAYSIYGSSFNDTHARLWNITNPFYYFFSNGFWLNPNGPEQAEILYFLAVWSLAVTVLSFSGIIRQYAPFVPLEENSNAENHAKTDLSGRNETRTGDGALAKERS